MEISTGSPLNSAGAKGRVRAVPTLVLVSLWLLAPGVYGREDSPAPRRPVFAPLRVGAVKPKGWILEQLRNDAENGLAAHFLELHPTYGASTYIRKNGNLGCGEMTGNWADGFMRMAYLSGAASAVKKADAFVAAVLGSREDDGYLGNVKPERRYRNAVTGELWSQSRLYMALLAYYELTGNRRVLDAVVTATRLTLSKYGPENRPFHRTPEQRAAAGGRPVQTHGLMFVDVLEWLYRLTGDRAYVEFSRFLYDDFSGAVDVDDRDDQLPHLLNMAYPFFWHGVHTVEQIRVPLFLAAAGVDPVYRQAAENAFTKLSRHIVPSGSCTSAECIYNARPTAAQYYEYCTTTELSATFESALRKTGRMVFGDRVECAVFNAAQGARTPDGKDISYLTADTRIAARESHDFPYVGKRRCKLSPAHEVGGSCCSANSVKIMPYYVCSMWARSTADRGLAALLYGPCEVRTSVRGVAVTIEEKTDYPFSDHIDFIIEPGRPVSFPLTLRIPGWAGKVTVDPAGGRMISGRQTRVITKTWKRGDRVSVVFENPIRLKRLVDGTVAIYRGPLLFVQPWWYRRIPLPRKLRAPGFHDFDLAGRPLYDISPAFIDCSAESYGFTTVHPRSGDRLHPWAEPPVVLEGTFRDASWKRHFRRTARLVPIGSALIRFASFRVWPFDESYFHPRERE